LLGRAGGQPKGSRGPRVRAEINGNSCKGGAKEPFIRGGKADGRNSIAQTGPS